MDQPTIIITGASRGIGAAAARIAAQKGARLVLCARDPAALEQVAGEITRAGGQACAVTADVSDYAACQAVVREAVRSFGRIDALINNAAMIGPLSLVANLPPDEWKRTIEVDLLGPVWMCREALPYLRQAGGRVINLSSGAAVYPIPTGSAYCSAKAALLHFSKILAREEPALTVLSYNPGEVDTRMQAEIREKGRVEPFEDIHAGFVEAHAHNQLMAPEQTALALVTLALAAPREWTGEYLEYEDERVQALVRGQAAG